MRPINWRLGAFLGYSLAAFLLLSATRAFDIGAQVPSGGASSGEVVLPQNDSVMIKTAPLSEFVLYSDGRPAPNLTVIATRVGSLSSSHARTSKTDSLGKFRIDSMAPGVYDLQVVYPGALRPFGKRITFDGEHTGDVIIPATPEPHPVWTIAFLLLYLATIVIIRWHHIARSIDQMLQAQLLALSTRIAMETDKTRAAEAARLEQAVKDLRARFMPETERFWSRFKAPFSPTEFLFWSRGRENAAWVALHEIEKQLAALMAPAERVHAHLHWAEAQLREIDCKPATALADAIVVSLQAGSRDSASALQKIEERKALLGRAMSIIFNDRDMLFSTMMEWHNKATWLIVAAIVIIGFVALAAGHSVLFLAGAAGGLLSRVMRAIKDKDIPLDYGASWTTLFLSPLFGALAGWFGVAIIVLATQPNVNLLGDAFDMVNWSVPNGPTTLAVAFLLGFSERLFNSIVGAVEGQTDKLKAAEEAAKSSPSTSVVSAPSVGASGASGAVPENPATSNGLRLELPDEAITPVQPVTGTIRLSAPTVLDVQVLLSTNNAAYVVPNVISIVKGEASGTFDVVPSGNAAPAVVTVSARTDAASANGIIRFGEPNGS